MNEDEVLGRSDQEIRQHIRMLESEISKMKEILKQRNRPRYVEAAQILFDIQERQKVMRSQRVQESEFSKRQLRRLENDVTCVWVESEESNASLS